MHDSVSSKLIDVDHCHNKAQSMYVVNRQGICIGVKCLSCFVWEVEGAYPLREKCENTERTEIIIGRS